MRVLIVTTQVPFVYGGAEILAEQLKEALITQGHEAEIVAIPFKWYPPERILEQMLSCRLLDLTESCGVPIDRIIGLKFPAYLIPHPNKVLWLLHQHRTAYELWDHEMGDLIRFPNGINVKNAIRNADKNLIPGAKAIFTIAENVSKRLKTYCDIDSTPLYHPPRNAENFYCAEDKGYLFYPSRLSPMKRQVLVLQALALTNQPVNICFAGNPDIPSYAEELKKIAFDLKVSNRIKWLGQISEEQKLIHYAHARAVVFPPIDEDYGYITLEAMLSSKAIITCTDSGGPLEFVIPNKTGLISEPSPPSLAAAFDKLWDNPEQAVFLGKAARARYDSLNISWAKVVERLLA